MAKRDFHDQEASGGGAASFGYRDVAEEEKPRLVQGVFDSVADNYDLMNDLMSGGIHRLWKKAMLDKIDPRPGETFLDVAGGTGDIAFGIKKRLKGEEGKGKEGRITICDLTPAMLRVGRDRAVDRGLAFAAPRLDWVAGDAERLPFPSSSMDVYTIAFGLRNVTHIDRALAEARRVLRPGGRFFCLEFSEVVLPVLDKLYDRFSFSVLPMLGEKVAKDRDSYVYLAESIRRFPNQERLVALMKEAGFAMIAYDNFSGGIAALHRARRI